MAKAPVNRSPLHAVSELRDQHADHIDSYVAGFKLEGKFIATFEHCSRAMIEIPLHMLVTLPPRGAAQGISARLECPVCKAALLVTIMPENGNARSGGR